VCVCVCMCVCVCVCVCVCASACACHAFTDRIAEFHHDFEHAKLVKHAMAGHNRGVIELKHDAHLVDQRLPTHAMASLELSNLRRMGLNLGQQFRWVENLFRYPLPPHTPTLSQA
jgi:hypothetical protein